ncbi:hypothetical protein U9M48_002353 [Paspalum notatum var. saurae]|uniref:Uncharacterized protein n=1 Tax=Paspalum notatum var. saurae TaxID=547442 RepID=A0AAQ3PKU7_PASNO
MRLSSPAPRPPATFALHACAWDATPQDVRHSSASADARLSSGQRRPRCTPAPATPNRRTHLRHGLARLPANLAARHPGCLAHATPCDHRCSNSFAIRVWHQALPTTTCAPPQASPATCITRRLTLR